MPLVSSLTGCSTCRRVLTSRKEIEPSAPDEVLDGAGAVVAGLGADGLGRLVDAGPLVVGEERRGRLLDQLLVAPLQRAVARADDDDVAVGVGQHLGLDVAGLVQEALDEALAAAEGGDGLADGGVEQLGDLLDGAGDLQPAPAAAERRLDGHRQAVLLGEGDDLVGVLDRVLGAGDQRGAGLGGDVPRLHLVAERDDRVGGGADPGEPGVDDGLGEVGVLREEAVAGVDRVGAGLLRGVQDLVDDEVGVAGRGAAEGEGLVGRRARAGRRGRARRRRPRWSGPRPCRRVPRAPRSPRGWRSGPSAPAFSLEVDRSESSGPLAGTSHLRVLRVPAVVVPRSGDVLRADRTASSPHAEPARSPPGRTVQEPVPGGSHACIDDA